MNGMYHIRPNKVEIDTWASFIDSGSDKWSWDKLFAAMQTSETFTPPSSTVQSEGDIQFVASSRGTSGPVHVSYPGLYVHSALWCLLRCADMLVAACSLSSATGQPRWLTSA